MIDKEIRDLKEKLTPSIGTPEYVSLSTNLRNHLEKEERDQRTKKQKNIIGMSTIIRPNLVFSFV